MVHSATLLAFWNVTIPSIAPDMPFIDNWFHVVWQNNCAINDNLKKFPVLMAFDTTEQFRLPVNGIGWFEYSSLSSNRTSSNGLSSVKRRSPMWYPTITDRMEQQNHLKGNINGHKSFVDIGRTSKSRYGKHYKYCVNWKQSKNIL